MSLEEIVKKSSGGIYNNAAQVWNHTLLLELHEAAAAAASPRARWPRRSTRKWGSYAAFKEAFAKAAVGNFGSGWTWLVKKADGSVDIVNTGAAGTPLTDGRQGAADARRLGARLLHRLPQPAPEVRRDLPRHAGELGLRRAQFRLTWPVLSDRTGRSK